MTSVAFELPRMRYVCIPPSLRDTAYSGRMKVQNEGRCRMCQRTHRVRPLTRHHIVPHSWFLPQDDKIVTVRNANANIVPLCRPCHDAVEDRDPVVRTHARVQLRRVLTQAEIAFAINAMGKERFDATYRWHKSQ